MPQEVRFPATAPEKPDETTDIPQEPAVSQGPVRHFPWAPHVLDGDYYVEPPRRATPRDLPALPPQLQREYDDAFFNARQRLAEIGRGIPRARRESRNVTGDNDINQLEPLNVWEKRARQFRRKANLAEVRVVEAAQARRPAVGGGTHTSFRNFPRFRLDSPDPVDPNNDGIRRPATESIAWPDIGSRRGMFFWETDTSLFRPASPSPTSGRINFEHAGSGAVPLASCWADDGTRHDIWPNVRDVSLVEVPLVGVRVEIGKGKFRVQPSWQGSGLIIGPDADEYTVDPSSVQIARHDTDGTVFKGLRLWHLSTHEEMARSSYILLIRPDRSSRHQARAQRSSERRRGAHDHVQNVRSITPRTFLSRTIARVRSRITGRV